MTGQSHPVRNRNRPAAFVLWGWALLLLVLLSAAPTGGAPRTRLVGSAFDPATVSVTVAPNVRDTGTTVSKLRRNSPADDAPGLFAIVDPTAARQMLVSERHVPYSKVPPLIPVSGALFRSHPARAPPLA